MPAEQAQHWDQSLEAFAVALQDPAVSSHPHVVCQLAQVCKARKGPHQQSTSGHTHVGPLNLMGLAKLAGLAAWMPKYPGLVGSIKFDATPLTHTKQQP